MVNAWKDVLWNWSLSQHSSVTYLANSSACCKLCFSMLVYWSMKRLIQDVHYISHFCESHRDRHRTSCTCILMMKFAKRWSTKYDAKTPFQTSAFRPRTYYVSVTLLGLLCFCFISFQRKTFTITALIVGQLLTVTRAYEDTPEVDTVFVDPFSSR